MLAVCDGGEKTPGIQGRVLCCDANKKDTEIFLNPLDKDQMRKIAYKRDGTIYTEQRDEKMEKDINDVLRLNGIQNENGTFHDTSTEIVKGRRDTYQNARKTLDLLMKNGRCTSKNVQEMIKQLENKEEYVISV